MRALLGTRKGLLILRQNGNGWKLTRAHFDGVKVSFASYDPVHKLVWAGLDHGHWGPKLHVSSNKGKSFDELGAPAFPEGHIDTFKDFWAFATDSQGRVYCGSEPGGLFYSDDRGESWTLCPGLDGVHGKDKWFGAGTDAHCLHSILIDPNDDKHILVGVSVAGMLETRDRGETWVYANKGLSAEYLPDKNAEVGQDPHVAVMSASDPNVLWQQNHCGIYKSTDMGQTWQDLSKAKGVKSAFGFGIVVDESNPDVAYTVPAASDVVRVPHKKRLFVQRTRDGGKSWKTLTKGLPSGTCYDLVYRHALALKDRTIAFGSTTGNFYSSNNRGKSWRHLPLHLPPIYSVKLF